MSLNTEKIIDRVRKLLAMAGDTTSPNEAAIAAKRARKLMDEYQLSELDLTAVESSDMGANYCEGNKTATTFDSTLAVAVAKINDVQAKYERNKITKKLDIRFEGMLVDTVCAVELFRYLKEQAYRQAEAHEQGRANRHAYRIGFSSGVAAQVNEIMAAREQLKTTSGTSLVVCKQQLIAQHFKPARYSKKAAAYRGNRSSREAGYAAGRRAGVSRQVTGHAQKRIAG